MIIDDSIYGTDLDTRHLVTPTGDLRVLSGLENAEQAIKNRLLTRYHELWELEYDNYNGNRSYDVIGETNQYVGEQKLKLFTEQCLLEEPRVRNILTIDITFDGKKAVVDVLVQLTDEQNTSNLIFTLGDEDL